jgi:hypothetical protein
MSHIDDEVAAALARLADAIKSRPATPTMRLANPARRRSPPADGTTEDLTGLDTLGLYHELLRP